MPLCIVLAGGASLRFPGGKLSSRLLGEPLLLRVVRALESSGLCRELAVSTSPVALGEVDRLLEGAYDVVVDYSWLPCRGPSRGIASATIHYAPREILLAAGDMAWLTPQPLEALVDEARRRGATAAAPMWATGFLQTLAGYIREPWLAVESCLRRGRLARPSDVYRSASKPLVIGSAHLGDRDGRTFMSVNTVEEMLRPRPDPPGHSVTDASEASGIHRMALARSSASLAGGLVYYWLEARWYREAGILHLARHAWQDYCWALHAAGYSGGPSGRSSLMPCRVRTLQATG
ncbi:MAG: NTP transferase domain-containing protein [Desulfurococcales archaeon]|nr:NTP transferase domain-containing protein [Desulfurococcales archaeon]